MIASPAQIAEVEQYFRTVSLPPVLKLNAATTLHDVPAFVRRTLENIKKPDISEVGLRPRWDDLLLIKQILEAPDSNDRIGAVVSDGY